LLNEFKGTNSIIKTWNFWVLDQFWLCHRNNRSHINSVGYCIKGIIWNEQKDKNHQHQLNNKCCIHKNNKHPFINLKASCFCCALPIKKKQHKFGRGDQTINWKFPMKFGPKEKSVTNTDIWRADKYTNKRPLNYGKRWAKKNTCNLEGKQICIPFICYVYEQFQK
jgi:hypothetical protein